MGTVLLDATSPLKWRCLRFLGEIKAKQTHFKRFSNYFDGSEGGRSPILCDSRYIFALVSEKFVFSTVRAVLENGT